MDLRKYKALFVEESAEHLVQLSRLLVELESSQEPGPIINEIFRHVHSVKGMAASMELGPIASLAHAMESVADLQRQRSEQFSRNTMDLLFQGLDVLGAQVDQVADDLELTQDDELLAALEQVVARGKTAVRQGPIKKPDAHDATPAKRTVHLFVDIAENAQAVTVRAFLVHRQLSGMGRIAQMQPSLEEIKQGRMEGFTLQVSLETQASQDELASAVRSIPDVEQVRFDAPDKEALAIAAVANVPQQAEAGGSSAGQAVPERSSESQKAVSTVRVRTDVLDGLIDSVGELFIARERIYSLLGDKPRPELRAALDALSTRIRDVHAQAMAVRMLPVRTLMERFPRLVRDLAKALHKEVDLKLEGGEIELDRAILDHLDAPFIHTLRNAVDHGVEPAHERLAAGKPAAGRVVISASRDRDTVAVVIEDDGRGLDADQLRRAAVSKGLLTEDQAASLSSNEAYFLICMPGFSTKSQVSDVSGRGVGMDAVRSKVEGLGGTLDIESHLGTGTRFIFRLPLTLAIIPVLLVQVAGRVFAVPVAKVVGVQEDGGDLIHQAGGGRYLSFQHALVPVSSLADVLRLASTAPAHQLVVIEDGRDLYALAVEKIVGYHEVVVKPLGDPLDRLEWFSGATILGDGQPILILDLPKALRWRVAA